MQAITRRQFLEVAIGVTCLSASPLCAAAVPAADSRFQGCFLRVGSVILTGLTTAFFKSSYSRLNEGHRPKKVW